MDPTWQQRGPSSFRDGRVDTGFRASRIEPEILPPDGSNGERPYYQPPPAGDYYQPPPPATPRRRATWAFAPATYTLLGINCAVFLGMLLTGTSVLSPTTDQLLNWGANNGTLVLVYGEWWRLITAMFVHVGII